ncbi:MAG: hypothetical protein KH208_11465, partial [Desulfovibrio sp.]|uniref:calcium-binding protein n=1 Tax=Desulfovibrio sp. TaxID=885 RepID=UPI0025BB18DD
DGDSASVKLDVDVNPAGPDAGFIQGVTVDEKGLNAGILDRFDNTDGSQILTRPDQLQDFLEPGKVVPPVFADRDALYGGAGQDVLFGDHVFYNGLDGMPALIAAIHAMDPNWDTSTSADIHQFLVEHPGFVDTLQDPNTASDQADLLVGGSGDDILAGQGGNDALFGDGGADKASDHSADAIHDLLGAYDKGADLFTGVHDLIEHGGAGEIDAFLKGIEGNADGAKHPGLESDHDGNDHLFGGSGDDMLFGMGGDDKLFGGDGSDALFGGSGDDFLDGGNDTVVDYLYGGSGNDILMYHSNDVIDGGSGTDVLLVGSNEDMDLLFAGGMDKVSDVDLIISGEDVSNLTSMEALKGIGISVGGNSVTLDDGWQKTESAHEGYDAYSNSSGVTVEVSAEADLQVTITQIAEGNS